jgi:[ribosomal protein S5]-alanine N-acetyltransferase
LVLETDRLIMTEWVMQDWMEFRPIASDPDVMRYIGDGSTWSDQRIQAFVERQMQEWNRYRFCLWKMLQKNDLRLVGFCGLQHLSQTEEIEIGWWLAKASWGKGLATEAARVVLHYGFETAALQRIVAIARPANYASIRIMEKLGMRYEKEMVRNGIPIVLYSAENPLLLRPERPRG